MPGHCKYTLLSDGSSDEALLPIINWLWAQKSRIIAEGRWADLRGLPTPKKSALSPLASKIELAVIAYPCDILFIHRDAEKQGREQRRNEIDQALEEVRRKGRIELPSHIIAIIPIRMQEAWLLIDEKAIRRAAGNPNGRMKLDLPRLHELEGLSDPKDKLHNILKTASGLRSTRLKRFRTEQAARRIADYLDDWSPLRALAAFQALETDVQQLIEKQGWNT